MFEWQIPKLRADQFNVFLTLLFLILKILKLALYIELLKAPVEFPLMLFLGVGVNLFLWASIRILFLGD
jgi:tellurite resistance protein TehA-like permease